MRSGECIPKTVSTLLDIFFEAVEEFNMRQIDPYTRIHSYRDALEFFHKRVPKSMKSITLTEAHSPDTQLYPRDIEEPYVPSEKQYPQICFRLHHSGVCINIFAVLYSNVIEPEVYVQGDHVYLKFFFMDMDWRKGVGIETFGVKNSSKNAFRDRMRGEGVSKEYREELWHVRCLLPPEFMLPILSFNDF